ncbi:MAG: hypothetical protein WD851_22645 [Pirellulales bacterium]
MDALRRSSVLRALLASLLCSVAAAQTPLPPTTIAKYETPSSRTTVTFGRRAPQVGDQVEQNVEVELSLRTLTRQGTKVLERGEQRLTRRQHRVITADRVEAGRTQAAYVKFLAADRQMDDEPKTAEPVVGKTYHCERDGERLMIHTAKGELPPLEEFRLVTPCMEMLGRAHPLADFFAERSVALDEKISLPEEVARELLGADDQFGKVSRFEMKLVRLEEIDGRDCAVFDAEIEATGAGASQMRLLVTGPLVLEVSTCRSISAEFYGPIGMSEVQGGYGARYQVDATGKFRVAVSSKYEQATAR